MFQKIAVERQIAFLNANLPGINASLQPDKEGRGDWKWLIEIDYVNGERMTLYTKNREYYVSASETWLEVPLGVKNDATPFELLAAICSDELVGWKGDGSLSAAILANGKTLGKEDSNILHRIVLLLAIATGQLTDDLTARRFSAMQIRDLDESIEELERQLFSGELDGGKTEREALDNVLAAINAVGLFPSS